MTLGDIPQPIVQATRDIASRNRLAQTNDAREALADQAEERLRRRYRTWLTVECFVGMEVLSHPSEYWNWLRQEGALSDANERYETFANRLDEFFLKNYPLIAGIGASRLVADSGRAYLLAPGRAPLTLPYGRPEQYTVHQLVGWNRVSFSFATSPDPGNGARSDKQLVNHAGQAAKWLTAALAETEDHVRQFIFAFVGLEVLVNSYGKAVESDVIEGLEAKYEIPLMALAWPAIDGGNRDRPWRNLVFRFAVVATRLSPDTTREDVGRFKEIARKRNHLAHGVLSPHDLDDLPSQAAVDLLSYYLAAVVDAHRAGGPPTSGPS